MRKTMVGWVVTTFALTAVLAVPSDGHFAGLGLVAASWFLLGVIALGLAVVRLRLPREEAELEARFGQEYRDYARRTEVTVSEH